MESIRATKYHYEALSQEKEIRVLVLHPGSEADSLQGHLRHVSLDDPPPYEALSYVWGDASKKDEILCHNGSLAITTNLHTALRYIREKDTERIIWADAICINQDDLDERGSQVQLMGQIYKSAIQTLVWLGEERKELKGSFQSVQNIRDVIMRVAGVEDILEIDPDTVADDDLASLRKSSQAWDWGPLVALLNLPWFQRKWVIQEIVLSKEIVLFCGYTQLPWRILEEFIICCLYILLSMNSITFDKQAPVAMDNISIMSALKQTQFKLYTLLFYTRKFLCTDPRDHIYALIGLASDVPVDFKGLTIDYSSPLPRLIQQFCIYTIKEIGGLDFLSCGYQATHEDASFPSWVPDMLSPNRYGGRFHFAATRNSAPQIEISRDETALSIMGKVIDKVMVLTQPLQTADDLGREVEEVDGKTKLREVGLDQIVPRGDLPNDGAIVSKEEVAAFFENGIKWFQHCKQIACPPGDVPASALRLEELYRTLLWDASVVAGREVIPVSLEKCSLVAEYLERMINWGHLFQERDEGWLERMRFLTCEVDVPMARVFGGRRFCSTANGYLGSMPRNTREGDIVCVFYGGKMPYVIRPCGEDRYKFVGDCYLHGFMFGKAMDSDLETQKFVLI